MAMRLNLNPRERQKVSPLLPKLQENWLY